MLPMRVLFKEFGSRDISEKSVVRPTYSYLGGYKISEKVMGDIVECVKEESENVMEVLKVAISTGQESQEGIAVYVTANFKYGVPLHEEAKRFQRNAVNKIEDMTAFHVNRLDLEVKDIIPERAETE